MSTQTLQEKMQADQMAARKSQDKLRVMVLGTTLSEMKNRQIELGAPLGSEDQIAVVSRAVKRRAEAAEQMRAGGREDLAQKEEQEAVILQDYLPKQLTEPEVRAMIQAEIDAGAQKMGDVMKALAGKTRGRFDGKALSSMVQAMLK